MGGRDGRIRVVGSPDYCVVIDGDKHKNGAKIQLWRCNENNPNQAWTFAYAGQISVGRKCLVIDNNEGFEGAKIQLWDCGTAQSVGDKQDWLQVALDPKGRAAYAVPDEDKKCAPPFEPVRKNKKACVRAAQALRPGQGCYDRPWATVVMPQHKKDFPEGCYFSGGCGGG